MRHDLSTGITTGKAITIAANNVTIDCNDFKLGGLVAGVGTNTLGIYAANRLNIRVRNCNIRGFKYGVDFVGSDGGGQVVEGSRFDSNTAFGIFVEGDGSVVRSNQINDTGGSTLNPGVAAGIATAFSVDVLDNAVNGVLPAADITLRADAYGITTGHNPSGRVSSNAVRGLISVDVLAVGIYIANSGRISVRGNDLSGNGSAFSVGINCADARGFARDNIITGFATGIATCPNGGGNNVGP